MATINANADASRGDLNHRADKKPAVQEEGNHFWMSRERRARSQSGKKITKQIWRSIIEELMGWRGLLHPIQLTKTNIRPMY